MSQWQEYEDVLALARASPGKRMNWTICTGQKYVIYFLFFPPYVSTPCSDWVVAEIGSGREVSVDEPGVGALKLNLKLDEHEGAEVAV